jgi:hypothetical protein
VWAVHSAPRAFSLSRSGTIFSSDDFLHHEMAMTTKKKRKRSDKNRGTEAFGYVITLATGLLLILPTAH